MITDRLLEKGGCNYGNTRVLEQATLPHVQSTGLAMLALDAQTQSDPRIARSLDYLLKKLNKSTATASLCFGLLGLTAHGRRPAVAKQLLSHALDRELERGTNCYKLALLSLAGNEKTSWLPKSKHKTGELLPRTGNQA